MTPTPPPTLSTTASFPLKPFSRKNSPSGSRLPSPSVSSDSPKPNPHVLRGLSSPPPDSEVALRPLGEESNLALSTNGPLLPVSSFSSTSTVANSSANPLPLSVLPSREIGETNTSLGSNRSYYDSNAGDVASSGLGFHDFVKMDNESIDWGGKRKADGSTHNTLDEGDMDRNIIDHPMEEIQIPTTIITQSHSSSSFHPHPVGPSKPELDLDTGSTPFSKNPSPPHETPAKPSATTFEDPSLSSSEVDFSLNNLLSAGCIPFWLSDSFFTERLQVQSDRLNQGSVSSDNNLMVLDDDEDDENGWKEWDSEILREDLLGIIGEGEEKIQNSQRLDDMETMTTTEGKGRGKGLRARNEKASGDLGRGKVVNGRRSLGVRNRDIEEVESEIEDEFVTSTTTADGGGGDSLAIVPTMAIRGRGRGRARGRGRGRGRGGRGGSISEKTWSHRTVELDSTGEGSRSYGKGKVKGKGVNMSLDLDDQERRTSSDDESEEEVVVIVRRGKKRKRNEDKEQVKHLEENYDNASHHLSSGPGPTLAFTSPDDTPMASSSNLTLSDVPPIVQDTTRITTKDLKDAEAVVPSISHLIPELGGKSEVETLTDLIEDIDFLIQKRFLKVTWKLATVEDSSQSFDRNTTTQLTPPNENTNHARPSPSKSLTTAAPQLTPQQADPKLLAEILAFLPPVSEPISLQKLSAEDPLESINPSCENLSSPFPLARKKQTGPPTLFLRIYLIPSDLPKFQSTYPSLRSTTIISKAKKKLKNVFERTEKGSDAWRGKAGGGNGKYILGKVEAPKTLLEIYNELPSPQRDPDLEGKADAVVYDLLTKALNEPNPVGMKSRLYGYQKNALYKLLARETVPGLIRDPRLTPQTSISGINYFLDPDNIPWTSADFYQDCRGGIICEEMGVGKTCISIALILATQYQRARVDETQDTPGPPQLFTNLVGPYRGCDSEGESHNHPVASGIRQRQRSIQPDSKEKDPCSPLDGKNSFASQSNTNPLPKIPRLTEMAADILLTSGSSYPYPYERELESPYLRSLLENHPPFYLIPRKSRSNRGRYQDPSLVSTTEYDRIYVSKTTLVVTPTNLIGQWQDELTKHVEKDALNYRVVLTPKDKIPSVREILALDLLLLTDRRFGGEEKKTRSNSEDVSPFLKIHFKRIIIDEGHVLGGANLVVHLAQKLRCEARWVVTGTPTANLRGFGQLDDVRGVDASLGVALSGGDAIDFDRLGKLLTSFLGLKPFTLDPHMWSKTISKPYLSATNGCERIHEILSRIMVRNRAADVEREVRLPPLRREVVKLGFTTITRITYNNLIASFAGNAILSDRQDQDYLGHKANAKFLAQLVGNLSASHFYYGASVMISYAAAAEKEISRVLDSDSSRTFTKEDRESLVNSIKCLQEANRCTAWKNIMGSRSISFHTSLGIDQELGKAWRAAETTSDGKAILFVQQVLKMRGLVETILRQTDWEDEEEFLDELTTAGAKVNHEDVDPKLHQATPKSKRRKRKSSNTTTAQPSPQTKSDEVLNHKQIFENTRPLPEALRARSLIGSVSSKLNHILNRVHADPLEKFLIFSNNTNTLDSIGEAFDVSEINYRMYVSSLTIKDRSDAIKDFRETQHVRVLLMDITLANRGLNICEASRIIFVEPVWQPDVQAQAEKRAHRIGSAKSVSVEILCLRGSFEEAMLERRKTMARNEMPSSPQEDTHLRSLLENARFIPASLVSPVPLKKPIPLFGQPTPVTQPSINSDSAMQDFTAGINDGPVRISSAQTSLRDRLDKRKASISGNLE